MKSIIALILLLGLYWVFERLVIFLYGYIPQSFKFYKLILVAGIIGIVLKACGAS